MIDNQKISRINICGIEIDNISMQETVDAIELLIQKDKKASVVTPNIDHIIKLQQDSKFIKAYKNASLVLVDGVPIIWASKFLGTPLKERINGTDLFELLCKIAADRGYKLFFLGGRSGAALKASKVLRKRHLGIEIVGVYSPPFGFENDKKENDKIIKMIKNSKPDILFVGLGAPKQEIWIYKHKAEYNVPVSIGIGVSFELVAGVIKRAPLWMQKRGLEWFWRLIMEPKKLCKRYLIDDIKFFWLVFMQKLNKFKNRNR